MTLPAHDEPSQIGATRLPDSAAQQASAGEASRIHLVVVTTRAVGLEDGAAAGVILRTRFWHPRDRRWSENDFESLEHARRLFVDESGWVLRQEQALDAALSQEWIFEAHRIDFAQPSKEEILQELGMTPDGVARILEAADRKPMNP